MQTKNYLSAGIYGIGVYWLGSLSYPFTFHPIWPQQSVMPKIRKEKKKFCLLMNSPLAPTVSPSEGASPNGGQTGGGLGSFGGTKKKLYPLEFTIAV